MTRQITPQTTLDNLRKEAKRWLKELRAGDAEARKRFVNVYAKAPADPALRDVQHAIALEFGHSNWLSLKQRLELRTATEESSQLISRFIEYACPDHHVRGRPAHRIARHAAMRILEQHPEIAHHNLYTAIVCGEVEDVERILKAWPELASAPSSPAAPDRSGAGGSGDIFKDIGPKGWEPLLYLCYTRLLLESAAQNAVAIARLLLDRGANPNGYFMAGNSRYTPLSGVIGEGEEDRPPHPKRDELARLLLERGAEPYDIQVVYNIHFHGDVLWFLKLMYEFSVKAGRRADWQDPEWHMLDMGNYGLGARWHLWIAVEHNNFELAEWCLQHGASANPAPASDQRFSQRTLYEEALRAGNQEISELLARYGAERTPVVVEGVQAFIDACNRLNRDTAQRLLAQNPGDLYSREVMLAAVRKDRMDVVEFLLDLGLPVDFEYDQKQRPLHLAANHDAVNVAKLLIDRGAGIDPVELNWSNTPIDFAVYQEYPRMIELLSEFTRDAGNLVFLGKFDRLRQLLTAEPALARLNWGSTPLFWLPEDEDVAIQIIDLLLRHGADPSFRRTQDNATAADIARRRGLLKAAKRLEAAADATAKYEALANDMVVVYANNDADAMQRLNQHYGRSATVDDLRATVWRLSYKVRRSQGDAQAFDNAEAKELISGTSGFPNWGAMIEAVSKGSPPPGEPFIIDAEKNLIAPRRNLSSREWDMLIDVMKERRIRRFEGHGFISDDVLERITGLDFVTSLNLSGSRLISDDGLLHLSRMIQLEQVELNEYPGGKLTDRGLEFLRHLPNLRSFEMTWQRGISDAGIMNLKFCEKLERVNLMGSPTGNGVIEALRGKPNLRRLDTGRLVTDDGLRLLHDFPTFKTWHDGESTHLLIDGPFTNAGLASLEGLDGVFALDLFWHVTGISAGGFAVLPRLANLGSLGCDGELSGDEAMRYIAAIPRLQKLRAQGSVATDDGFIALSQSASLEEFWGRECPNLTGRGFVALSGMPALRSLGVSCKKVDDDALSTLPLFPALRKLTPIDVSDTGFRHVGKCIRLEDLSCMYCRDTTDEATGHIANLQLKTYYAGLTQITDRSLEILGRMPSIEYIELYETKKITEAGLAHLAGLPRLREVHLCGLPHVTFEGTKVFPSHIKVQYMTVG